MLLTLTILNGVHAGHAVSVAAGTPRTFGRAAQSDVALQDVYLSDVHFAVYCDDAGARVRDLQSHNGTFVNGVAVDDAALGHGDRITAGQTTFEAAFAARAGEAPAGVGAITGDLSPESILQGMQHAPHDLARWALHAEDGRFYAVVDCARDPELLTLVNRIDEEFCAFDETREPDDLGTTAPFLVALTPATEGLAEMFDETWGRGHAIFVVSPKPFIEVYQHLVAQTSWTAQGLADGRRFWDPAQLGVILGAADDAQRAAFFEGVTCVLAEGPEARVVHRYALDAAGALAVTVVPLVPPAV